MSDRPLSSGGCRIGSPRRDSNSEVADAPDIMGISKPTDLEITTRGGEINESTFGWHHTSATTLALMEAFESVDELANCDLETVLGRN